MTATCNVEGCTRTTSGDNGDAWICSVHWRRYCPPRSRRRRAYHWFFKQAKRHGWRWKGPTGRGETLDWRFWRFWQLLVAVANAGEKSDTLDMTELNKMFGWDDDELSAG